MALNTHDFDSDDMHPIDLVEHVAEHHRWDFDRIHDDQIAMSVEGQWRNYAITLAWSAIDETLRLICTFEMEHSTRSTISAGPANSRGGAISR